MAINQIGNLYEFLKEQSIPLPMFKFIKINKIDNNVINKSFLCEVKLINHMKNVSYFSETGAGSTKKTAKQNASKALLLSMTVASNHINRLRKQFPNNDKVGISLQKEFQMDNKRYLYL